MSNAETCTLAEETARRFLKSVVIIDNEASFDNSDGSHSLDIQKLTCAFAEKDILCSVLKPCKDGLDAERYANMVCAADAAVLDWQMPQSDNKDKTSLCREIIRNVFHREKGKRPRLIFIYTGETITETLLEQLKKSPVDAGVDEFSDSVVPKENGVGLVVDKLHIIFVGKEQKSNGIDGLQPEAGGGAAKVSVGDLPNHLLHEYACLTDGILPDAAFNAVATVRENTGNLLSLFKKELDPAFVHHLLLISDLRDGEAYLHELLRDAMYSPSGTERNFNSPQEYQVTAADGIWKKTYAISVIDTELATIYNFEDTISGKKYYIFVERENDKVIMEWASGNAGAAVVLAR